MLVSAEKKKTKARVAKLKINNNRIQRALSSISKPSKCIQVIIFVKPNHRPLIFTDKSGDILGPPVYCFVATILSSYKITSPPISYTVYGTSMK